MTKGTGIYLVENHAFAIYQKRKKAIVKARHSNSYYNDPLFLITKKHGQGLVLGRIKLGKVKTISLDEFRKLRNLHLVTEEERKDWWPNRKKLFLYPIKSFVPFIPPKEVDIKKGVQTIQDISFIKDISDYDPSKLTNKVLADDLRIVCFPKGTPVLTPRGIEEISSIQPTFNLDFLPLSRHYEGDLIKLKIDRLGEFRVTPEHPILVRKIVNHSHHGHKVFAYSSIRKKGLPKASGGWETTTHQAKWKLAKDLQRDDAVLVPKLKIKKTRFSRELFELSGWYLAEGFPVDPFSIRFSLSPEEEDYAKRIKSLAEKEFKANVKISKLEKEIRVNVYSRSFHDFCLSNFSHSARKKTLPLWVLEAEPSKIKALLDAWRNGDGCDVGNYHRGTTSSPLLAYGLFFCYLKIGIVPSISHSTGESNFGRFDRYDLSYVDSTRKTFVEDENFYYFPIREVLKEKFSGTVFNLETKSHIYFVPFLVHNCAWWWRVHQGKTFKFTKEQVLGLAKKIYDEMKKRGFKFHPEKMQPLSRELYQKVSTMSFDKQTAYLPIYPGSQSKRGSLIKLDDFLRKWKSMKLFEQGIILVGSLANWGETTGDIDIVIKAEEDSDLFNLIAWRIMRAYPEYQDRLHFIPYGHWMGPFTSHINLADIVAQAPSELRVSEMTKEQEESEKSDKLVPFRPFYQQKPQHGRHVGEAYNIDSLIEVTNKTWPDWKEKGVYVGVKRDGVTCFHYDEVVITERGKMKIGDIVNEKRDVKVLSWNEKEKKPEFKKIVNYWKSKNDQGWLDIYYSKGSSRLFLITCTPDHKFYTPRGKVEAKDLTPSDSLLGLGPSLTHEQLEVAVGTVLGDGCLIRTYQNPHLSTAASFKYFSYLSYKASCFSNLSPKFRKHISGYGKECVSFRTLSSQSFNSIKNLLYKDGKRCISPDLIEYLTPRALAIWCMDDGTGNISAYQRPRFSLALNRYSDKDAEKLRDMINSKFGFHAKLRDSKGWVLDFSADETEKLIKLVKDYFHPDFAYKLNLKPEEVGSKLALNIPTKPSLIPYKVEKVVPSSKRSARYNLEIEDNHNYFVGDVLVGNCQAHWDHGKVRIWTEEGKEVTKNLPTIVSQLAKKPGKCVVIGELEWWHEGKHMPRADAAAIINHGGEKEKEIVLTIYDKLYSDSYKGDYGDIHLKPYSFRREQYLKIHETPNVKVSKNEILCKTEDCLRKAVKKMSNVPGSEGAMLKLATAPYHLTVHPSKPSMIKFKKEYQLVAKVIGKDPVEGAKAWVYDTALKDAPYLGKTYNTSIAADIGDHIIVSFVDISEYHDPETGKVWFNVWAPHVIGKTDKPLSTAAQAHKLVLQTTGRIQEKRVPKRGLKYHPETAKGFSAKHKDCINFDPKTSKCMLKNKVVDPEAPACPSFQPRGKNFSQKKFVWQIHFRGASVSDRSPIIVKDKEGRIKVIPIKDLFTHSERQEGIIQKEVKDLFVWSKTGWTKIIYASRHPQENPLSRVICNEGLIEVTDDHSLFQDDQPIQTKDLTVSSHLDLLELPKLDGQIHVDKNLAWLYGFYLAEGNQKSHRSIEITSTDLELLKKAQKIATNLGFKSSIFVCSQDPNYKKSYKVSINLNIGWMFQTSGVHQLTERKARWKIVPSCALNWDKESQKAFLEGYFAGDGISIDYSKHIEWASASQSVAQGILLIARRVFPEFEFFRIDHQDSVIRVALAKRHNLLEERNKIKKIIKASSNFHFGESNPNFKDGRHIAKPAPKDFWIYDKKRWVYDIETENHDFLAGVGRIRAHNSAHVDFRVQLNHVLGGWTLAAQTKALKEELDKHWKLEKKGKSVKLYWDGELYYEFDPKENIVKKPSKELEKRVYEFHKRLAEEPRFWKIDFNTGEEKKREATIEGKEVAEKVWASQKSKEPYDWLFVEGVTPPRQIEPSPGGTRFYPGIFVEIDSGTYDPGAQKTYYHEYFLHGKKIKGRVVLRQVAGLKQTKQPLTWLYWKPSDQTPYVLSKRAIKERWLPDE